MINEKCPNSAIQEEMSEQRLSKCKLCPDSVQREGKVGFKRLVGLDKMDKELGWKSKDG